MAHTQVFSIQEHLSPLLGAVRSDAESTLGSVFSLVNSSHEAVFVFEEDDEFLGLVSPFGTLYSSNFPYTTKVSSIAFVPPHINIDTPVYEVADHMLSTKVYALPVFDDQGEIIGIIRAQDIMREIIKNPRMLKFISEKIVPHDPITAPITATVKDIFHDFKEKGVSRMILVDAEGDLAGIVTRGDLMDTLIKPTSKLRFAKEGSSIGLRSLAGEKKSRQEEPVRKYHTALVDALSEDTPPIKIITHLVNSKYNSVVLTNKYQKPTGFLSTRDILHAITLLRPEPHVALTIMRPSASVTDAELTKATEHVEHFGIKLKKQLDIKSIEVSTQEPKSPHGDTKVFAITIMLTPVSGKTFVAVTEHRNFIDGIQEATKLIERQVRKNKPSN